MIFVCFVVFTFLFVAFFGGGKLITNSIYKYSLIITLNLLEFNINPPFPEHLLLTFPNNYLLLF